MKINQFSQQGKRSNNEDSLGMSLGLLTVCDGMGGHNFAFRLVHEDWIQFNESTINNSITDK